MPLPAALKGLDFEKQDATLFSAEREGPTGLAVRVRPASGALYLSGKRDFDTDVLNTKRISTWIAPCGSCRNGGWPRPPKSPRESG